MHKILLCIIWGINFQVAFSQNHILRLYINQSGRNDSADFPLHIDPMHIASNQYIQCGEGKIYFHKVWLKNDSLFAEIRDFPVLFRFKWDHSGTLHRGFWTHALKAGFRGKAAILTQEYHLPKNITHAPAGNFNVIFMFKKMLLTKWNFFPSKKEGLYAISIESPSGDFGHIQGYFIKDSLFAYSFNGSGFFIIKGRLQQHSESGIYITETGSVYPWKKIDVVHSTPPHQDLFQLPVKEFHLENKKFSYLHDSLKGRPLVIHLLGSWCHNCRDEVMALKEFVRAYSGRGVFFSALVVEKQNDTAHIHERIRFIKNRWGIFWPAIPSGISTKDQPGDLFGIKKELPYPTLLVFNKNHEPVYIHEGFSGPATGESFEKWKREFHDLLEKISIR
ncbi:MAG: TlpA family protein disulfide reductase [Bacteroidia bacterium]|nr:TlpA family protein disulfide reductase [Bacteroidia bacterium]